MFRKLKAGYVAGLAAALMALGVQACNEPLPTSPVAASTVVVKPGQTPADLNLVGGLVTGVLTTTKNTVTTTVCVLNTIVADIGIDGGTISLCGNSLVIPAHSLRSLTHIQLVPVQGQPGVVQFYPEGLQFSPSAKPTLTLSTDGIGNPANAYIVYTDDEGNVKEVETTTSRTAHTVSAQIGHFSRYAVSW
jgi:hypothetical protein